MCVCWTLSGWSSLSFTRPAGRPAARVSPAADSQRTEERTGPPESETASAAQRCPQTPSSAHTFTAQHQGHDVIYDDEDTFLSVLQILAPYELHDAENMDRIRYEFTVYRIMPQNLSKFGLIKSRSLHLNK